MKKTLITAVAVALLALGLGASAEAASITIGLQQAGVNGGAITTVAGPVVGTTGVNSLAYGTFTANNVDGTTNPVLPLPQLINSNSLNVSSTTAGTLQVYVTTSGLTTPVGALSLQSSFTTNLLTAGWTVTEQTFLDTANDIFTGALLATNVFNAIGTNVQVNAINAGAGPYSITTKYTIVATGQGSANSTINVSSVPEPTSIVLLGMGLLGVVGLARKKS